jgi:outer membrane protein assembly factor BamB
MFRRSAILMILLLPCSVWADPNWPQWRGPSLNGVAEASDLPVEWSLDKNVVWKSELPSWSGSTPIVWGDRVFVTSPSPVEVEPESEKEEDPWSLPRQRRQGRDPGGQELLLIALNRADGSELWRRKLAEGNELHRKGNNASPSPVTDGTHVWAVTGTGSVSAFTVDGEPVWQRNLQDDYGKFGLMWGYASSPLLFDDKLIVEVLHGMHTDDPSYVVAYDALSGDVVWRQERPTQAPNESPDAYTTPTVVQKDGTTRIVITGGDVITGHDPETGEEVWRAAGLNPESRGNYRIVASPVVAGGLIYAPTRKTPLLAFRPGGSGDVTDSHLVWSRSEGAEPDVPTPVSDGTYFYMVNDNGLATCLNAGTGEVVWGPERTAQGIVSSSPVLADGKLYVLNEGAVTTVLKAGPQFEVLATNELDGTYTISSIAVAGNQLFVRTSTHLYCISK